ncbi:hypothetical protein ACFTSF_11335 [Kribbella sp. NPDC056951]|uniref:hypothetical protein n=1 Tax=Kribbella sp. NPDC056951 TaxID=3345978 RepID=UPI0036265EF9
MSGDEPLVRDVMRFFHAQLTDVADDTPSDEYKPEAELLVQAMAAERHPVAKERLVIMTRDIFSDMFEENYDLDAFARFGDGLARIFYGPGS